MFRLTKDVASLFELGGTLIVPSRQRAHAVRLAHAVAALAAGRRVWSSPDVLSLAAWTRREAERVAADAPGAAPRLLSAAEEWLLWRQCALEVTQGMPLLDAAPLGESLQQASALAAEFRIALHAPSADSEVALLVRAQREFTVRCQAVGARSAASVLAGASLPASGAAAALMVRGFDVLPRRLAELVGTAPAATSDARETEQLLVAADEREELERIASWCATRIRGQSDARLLVLLPGPAGARERLATLIRQTLDPRGSVETSAAAEALVSNEDAEPLSQVPLIRHALSTLDLLQGAQAEAGEWSRWLRAPQFTTPSEVARARLDARLRERAPAALTLREFLGALQVLPRELLPTARELAAQLTRAAAVLSEGRAAPRQWAERCRDAVKAAWGAGSAAAPASETRPLVHWHELLEEFGQLTGSVPLMSRGEAVQVLTDLATRTPLRGADEDASVTLSALLADPVVHYDGIWVAGLQADVFPQPVQPNPFLPLAAQRAAGVPTASAEGRIGQARELLSAWRAHAGELVLSAPARTEDLELLPSPLLSPAKLHRPEAAPSTPAAPSARTVWLPALMHRGHETELFRDEQGRRWNPAEPLPRGTRSLDLQNTCPFRAYAELRLGATRPEIPEPGVPLNIRGQLLHAALERLWAELLDSRALGQLSAETLGALIARCVQEAAAQLAAPQERRRGHRAPSGQLDMFREIPRALARDCRRAEQLIAALCQLDRARGEFRVVGTEQGVDLRLAGARLRMRIDRIDELADGGLVVLDYKTGTHRAADWYGERPTYPQLLAYLSALGDEVAALAAVWVSSRELRFDGVSRARGLLPGVQSARAERGTPPEAAWQTRRQGWRIILERLIGAFLAGDAQLDPKPGACRSCHVISVCRIGERAAGRENAMAGEGADD